MYLRLLSLLQAVPPRTSTRVVSCAPELSMFARTVLVNSICWKSSDGLAATTTGAGHFKVSRTWPAGQGLGLFVLILWGQRHSVLCALIIPGHRTKSQYKLQRGHTHITCASVRMTYIFSARFSKTSKLCALHITKYTHSRHNAHHELFATRKDQASVRGPRTWIGQ